MIANGEEVATNEDRAMNVVIVRAAPGVSRTYYEGQFKDGESVSPVCWSADGVTPDPKAPAPQGSKCDTCPQNIRGSGQGESKACRYARKMAVVLDGDVEGDVFQVSLSAISVFGKGEPGKLPLEAYARQLASHNVPVTAVVTEMRFDTSSPVPKLTFKAVRGLTEAEWETCREKAETEEAREAIRHTFTVKPKDDEKPAPKVTVKAKPKLVVEDTEEAEAAPVKVQSKKSAAAPATTDIGQLINDWADD
jgi:hypothetical protein